MGKELQIALADDGVAARRITKIIQLKDGFAITMPSHKADSGYVYKHKNNLAGLTAQYLPISEWQPYSADSKAKLSFHLDGFVQFSGHGIRSGYDAATGTVKGLGLKGDCPVDISTGGPAFTLTVWGLDDFKELGDKKANVLLLDRDDFYFDEFGPRNGYQLEGFIMPKKRFFGGIRNDAKGELWTGEMPYFSIVQFRHELRVVNLQDQSYFLAFKITKASVDFKSESGFVLQGPAYQGPDESVSTGISAMYPKQFDLPEANSLDYSPSKDSPVI